MTDEVLPRSGAVEDLLAQVEGIDPTAETFELWVPAELTLRADPVTLEIAMAIILDRLLAKNMYPRGFVSGIGGRRYRYERE